MEGIGTKGIKLIDLGLKGYQEVWDIQKHYFNEILDAKLSGQAVKTNYILTCQHAHVITLGKSGKESNIQIPAFPGVEYIRIDRGGDITYHGPGQLVVYPILDLEAFGLGLKTYIHVLEEAVIETLKPFGIEAGRIKEYTGVWLDSQGARPRKIAAIGVKTSRHVTMHGLAFNIKPDLAMFNLIIPCGIQGKEVTSLEKEIGKEVDYHAVTEEFKRNLIRLLGGKISN